MKKLLIYIYLIIFISNFFLVQVYGRDNIFTSPLLIFNNPSLLSKQQGLPIGLEIQLNSLDSISFKKITLCGGLSYLSDKNAVAIGYLKNNKNINILSTGFSHFMLISSLGTGLKVELYENLLFPNIDISYMVKVNKTLSFNIVMKNIYTQYRSKNLYPEVLSYIHGCLNNLNFELGYRGIFYDYSRFRPLHSLEMLISYELLQKKTFYIALENSIHQNKENSIIAEIGIFLGISIRNGQFKSGISTGYQHEINNSKGKIVNNILINPLYYNYQRPQKFELSYKCSQNVDNELVFNIDSVDKGEEIKKWSLIITDDEDDKKIIKAFFGGNIPPKTVIWDFKDSYGTFYKGHSLKAQIIVSDKNKNSSVSPIVVIYPCTNN